MLFAPLFASQVPHLRPANCGLARSIGTKIPQRYALLKFVSVVRLHLAGAFCTTLRLASSSFALSKLRFLAHRKPCICSAICTLKVCYLVVRVYLAGAFCTTLRLASSSFAPSKLRTCSLDWHKNPSAICTLKVCVRCSTASRRHLLRYARARNALSMFYCLTSNV